MAGVGYASLNSKLKTFGALAYSIRPALVVTWPNSSSDHPIVHLPHRYLSHRSQHYPQDLDKAMRLAPGTLWLRSSL